MDTSCEDSYNDTESFKKDISCEDSFVVEDSLILSENNDTSFKGSSFSEHSGGNSINSPQSVNDSNELSSAQETPRTGSESSKSVAESPNIKLQQSFKNIRTPGSFNSDSSSEEDNNSSFGDDNNSHGESLNLINVIHKPVQKITDVKHSGTLGSDSDSDEDASPIKMPVKNKKRVHTIQSDSESDAVISVPSTRSTSPADNNVIDVSSEEENIIKNNLAPKKMNSTILKQTTLDSVVQKIKASHSKENSPVNNATTIMAKNIASNISPSTFRNISNNSPQENKLLPSFNVSDNKDVIYCTQKEYTIQASRVSGLRTDVKRTKLLQSTINKDNLPDKGVSLKMRQESLEKALHKEEVILNKMVVENEAITDAKPNAGVSWEHLQAGSAAVVPNTWGKQAVATHTLQKSLTMDRLKDLHGSLATCPGEDELVEDPKHLKVELMKHQKRALAWLLWRENQNPSGGILADDMGLGKTLTMISLVIKSIELKHEVESDEEKENFTSSKSLPDGGTLVICPATLLKQWEGEVLKKCKKGLLNIEVYHGINRESKPQRLAKQDMIITTYNLAMRECEKKGTLFRVKWRRIILDEAHVVRNYKSQTSIAMCSLHGKSRWALTGTPVHNKELDLYALLKFLRCTPFDDLAIWKRWVVNKNAGGQDRLNTVMQSIMLRRTKLQLQSEGALQGLPEKQFELIQVKLDKTETQVYQKVLIFSKTLFAQFLHQRAEKNTDLAYDSLGSRPNFLQQNDPNGEYYKMHKKILKMHGTTEIKSHEILVLLLRLRQICCHPSLIVGMLDNDTYEDEGIEEDGVDVDILDKLNKLDIDDDVFDPNAVPNPEDQAENFNKAASKLLSTNNPVFDKDRTNEKIRKALEIIKEKVIANGDKAVVVSQWTKMLHIVDYHFKAAGVKCQTLDGSVPVIKRNEIVENFNNSSHNMKVLLLSLTAGGVGLNLVGGNHLILLDLHWNPQLESQAQDRIYRVGQNKTVIIYKFVTMDTIEERIKALQDNKLQMASDILSGTKAMPGSKLSLDDLKMLFSV